MWDIAVTCMCKDGSGVRLWFGSSILRWEGAGGCVRMCSTSGDVYDRSAFIHDQSFSFHTRSIGITVVIF